MPDLSTLALVLVGGGIGSVLRWGAGLAVLRRFGIAPLGTFVVNVSGCFAIGLLSTLLSIAWQDRYDTALTALLLTGILGGYTTFSSYELDALGLAAGKDRRPFAAYWVGSIVAGLVAAFVGHQLGVILAGTP
jgi:fluoride exporter